MFQTDTIAALASGRGRAAIAVVRISGPATGRAIEALTGALPEPRMASVRSLRDPRDGELIDKGLVLWFPGPASFTGEDAAEFQIHGGPSVTAGLLDALMRGCGIRLAEPGEYARRAFENGKLDLTEVEGLADLIDAETAMQRRQALRQLDGALGKQIELWRLRLIKASAWAEAMLDFSDEGDVDQHALNRAMDDVRGLAGEIEGMLDTGDSGERLRDGYVVVIAGPPNAGKSTLLNYLAKRDVAIVSPIAGTTRDSLEVHMDMGGWPVVLIDTAGIRDSADPIEREGIERARTKASRADLVLWLLPHNTDSERESPPFDQAVLVRTKSDISPDSPPKHSKESVNISAMTGAGIDDLLAIVSERAAASFTAGSPLITRHRHRQALTEVATCLKTAIHLFEIRADDELTAEELRLALRGLGRVTGRVDVEDILGALFSGFCIGK